MVGSPTYSRKNASLENSCKAHLKYLMVRWDGFSNRATLDCSNSTRLEPGWIINLLDSDHTGGLKERGIVNLTPVRLKNT